MYTLHTYEIIGRIKGNPCRVFYRCNAVSYPGKHATTVRIEECICELECQEQGVVVNSKARVIESEEVLVEIMVNPEWEAIEKPRKRKITIASDGLAFVERIQNETPQS